MCRKGLMLETFGMIERRQTAVFSMIWMGYRELQKPRWDMIKARTKSFAESLVEYSRTDFVDCKPVATSQGCCVGLA